MNAAERENPMRKSDGGNGGRYISMSLTHIAAVPPPRCCCFAHMSITLLSVEIHLTQVLALFPSLFFFGSAVEIVVVPCFLFDFF